MVADGRVCYTTVTGQFGVRVENDMKKGLTPWREYLRHVKAQSQHNWTAGCSASQLLQNVTIQT